MAAKKKPSTSGSEAPGAPGGFDAWRSARRGSEVEDAKKWRAAYQEAISAKSASTEVMALLMDGMSVKRTLWKYLTGPDGKAFTSFPAFSSAEPPFGLGILVDDLRRLRRVLRFNFSMEGERVVTRKRAKGS